MCTALLVYKSDTSSWFCFIFRTMEMLHQFPSSTWSLTTTYWRWDKPDKIQQLWARLGNVKTEQPLTLIMQCQPITLLSVWQILQEKMSSLLELQLTHPSTCLMSVPEQASPATQRRARASLSDLSHEEDIESLTVRQLKEILARNFVNYSGCCEKWELVERVHRLYRENELNRRSSKTRRHS